MSIWERTFLGSSLRAWSTGLGVAVGGFLLLWLLRGGVVGRLSAMAPRMRNRLGTLVVNLARDTRVWVLAIIAFYAGSLFLVVPANLDAWLASVVLAALLAQATIWGNVLIAFWLSEYQERHLEDNADRVTTARTVGFVLRLILYAVVILLALDNVPGVQVTTLIASLGITGIAVALAVQNILSDLFASLSIALDKPFAIGDFIVVGEDVGTVEQIGLKTTRLRSLSGEQLVFANSDLLSSRIRNFKRMQERRIAFSIGVTYQTPPGILERIPDLLREIVVAQAQTRFDRAHWSTFGDYALNFEVVYFMLTTDYMAYMDTQQAINLAILRRFAQEGIEIAYPTQTLLVRRTEEA